MSTRSAIGRPAGDGWEGRYHHSDGYPDGLGQFLHSRLPWGDGFTDEEREQLSAYAQFEGDVERMAAYFIDEHPGGWSFVQVAGLVVGTQEWRDRPGGFAPQDEHRPRCYCHSGDAEEGTEESLIVCRCPADNSDCDPLFIEYAYVINPRELVVYDAYDTGEKEMRDSPRGPYETTKYAHRLAGKVPWGEPKSPEFWETIHCGENFEYCQHYAHRHFPAAEGTNVGVDVWLGRKGPTWGDCRDFVYNGKTYTQGGGSMLYADGTRPDWHEPMTKGRPKYWWATLRDQDGTTIERRIARVTKTGYVLEKGFTAVVPTAAGTLELGPGTVL